MAFVKRSSIAVLFVALFLVLVAIPSWSSDAIASSAVLNAEVAAPFECDIDCGDQECDSGYHDAWNTSPNFYFWTRNGGVHSYPWDCRLYTCDVRHGPWCNPAEPRPDMDAIRKYVRDSDVKSIARVVSESQQVKWNQDRAAVQVIDCKGGVVMHLPVRSDVARRITARLLAN